jgi:hypothetical protein
LGHHIRAAELYTQAYTLNHNGGLDQHASFSLAINHIVSSKTQGMLINDERVHLLPNCLLPVRITALLISGFGVLG